MKKYGEIVVKNITNYVKGAKDVNISAMEPAGYSVRFIKHVKNCIKEE